MFNKPVNGWQPDSYGRFDERYYVNGSPTGNVKAVQWDERFGGDPASKFVVEGYTVRVRLRSGCLVVEWKGLPQFKVVVKAEACSYSEFIEVRAENGSAALRLDLAVQVGNPADDVTVRLWFPLDKRDELAYLKAELRMVRPPVESEPPAATLLPADAVTAEPDTGEADTEMVTVEPAPIELVVVEEPPAEPPCLARLPVLEVPDIDDWLYFTPLGGSTEVLVRDEETADG